MRAILISVDYADLLGITLEYNRHHFEQVVVVTTSWDLETGKVARNNNANIFVTDAFYEHGATFNKWKALEEGLDYMGRRGWLCIMDADVLWPKQVDLSGLKKGNLYTPKRRMMIEPSLPIPAESEWSKFHLHPQQREFAGYTQIFHADDPVLGHGPWHETNWKHAGGADSFFQERWQTQNKVRPPFEVLHLGESGVNWCGRASKYLDGSKPAEAAERREALSSFIRGRRQGAHRFDGEKIKSKE